MFVNPGKSLKKMGGIVLFVGMIISTIGGVWMFYLADQASRSYSSEDTFRGLIFGGIIIIVIGLFISYLMSIFIVAFGELVENSTAIKKNLSDLSTHQSGKCI